MLNGNVLCPCGEDIHPKRHLLGYRTCLTCGDTQLKANPPTRCVVPLNKSNYMLITNRTELQQLNPKRTQQ